MNKLVLSILTLSVLTGSILSAEEKTASDVEKKTERQKPATIFGDFNDVHFSGYLAPVVKFSRVSGETATFAGGRGALLINDNWGIGGGGYGLANPSKRNTYHSYSGTDRYVNFGYGGGMVEYYFMPKSLIHFSAGLLIGGGGLNFSDRRDNDDNDEDNYGSNSADKFFVAEPEVNVFVNVTRFCRIGAGVSYRFIKGLNNEEFSSKDFSGVNATALIQFGWF